MALRTFLTLLGFSATLSLQAAFYPLWLEPDKCDDSGIAVVATAETSGKASREALGKLRFCIENYPGSANRPWYIFKLADGLYEFGEPDSAISWFKVLETLPESTSFSGIAGFSDIAAARTEAWLGMARCQTAKGNTPEAVNNLLLVLPRNDEDRLLIAELQYALNRRQSAAAMLEETSGAAIADPVLRMRAGMLYRALKLNQKAEAIFKSLADGPESPIKSQAQAMLRLVRMPTPDSFINGKYTGKAQTAGGELEVEITINRGKLEKINYSTHPFKKPYAVYESAARRMTARNLPVIDPVRGAEAETVAIEVAVADALEKARRN